MLQSILNWYYPYLIAFCVNQADFGCVNILIDRRLWCAPTPIRSLFNN
ncbi:MAG: hypothetical protein NZ728_08755 [Oleiphilaceae bacterium]|nr:hypothetical protein [Oleiphilaceae bacterium]